MSIVFSCIEARHQIAIKYREALRGVEGITFFDDMPGVKHNYSYFPIFVDAHKMADSVICLPMHHALSEEDIERTLECILK